MAARVTGCRGGRHARPAGRLPALLRDVEDAVEVAAHRDPVARRKRTMHGPSPVRLLVEAHGLTLDQLRAAVLEDLDQPGDPGTLHTENLLMEQRPSAVGQIG